VGMVRPYLGIASAPSMAHFDSSQHAYAGRSKDDSRQLVSRRTSSCLFLRPCAKSGLDTSAAR
jgi:hypothetical protein